MITTSNVFAMATPTTPPAIDTVSHPLAVSTSGARDVSALHESQEGQKYGKDHRYFSVVESRRLSSGKMAQRTVLYLGEINDSQQAAWLKTLDVFDEQEQRSRELSLIPDDREIPEEAVDSLQVKHWFLDSAMDELLGVDFAVAGKDGRSLSAGDDGNAFTGACGEVLEVARIAGEDAVAMCGNEYNRGVNRIGGSRAANQNSGFTSHLCIYGPHIHRTEKESEPRLTAIRISPCLSDDDSGRA